MERCSTSPITRRDRCPRLLGNVVRALQAEIPAFAEVAGQADVVFVGVAVDSGAPAADYSKAEEWGITWPVVVEDGSATRAYDVSVLRTTVVIGPNGEVRSAHVGAMSAAQLQASLGEQRVGERMKAGGKGPRLWRHHPGGRAKRSAPRSLRVPGRRRQTERVIRLHLAVDEANPRRGNCRTSHTKATFEASGAWANMLSPENDRPMATPYRPPTKTLPPARPRQSGRSKR